MKKSRLLVGWTIIRELKKDMTFSDIVEGRRIMNYYAMANGYDLRIVKTDPTRTWYICELGMSF